MTQLIPDLLAILVIVLICAVIVGVPYSIFICFPRAFRRGLNDGLKNGNPAHRPNNPTEEAGQQGRAFVQRADALAALDLPANATQVDIRAAYRTLVSEWHPDRLNNMAKELRDIATEKLKRINEAYELLTRKSGFE
jgi:hypothetical protein